MALGGKDSQANISISETNRERPRTPKQKKKKKVKVKKDLGAKDPNPHIEKVNEII